jgi:hypothetical protein
MALRPAKKMKVARVNVQWAGPPTQSLEIAALFSIESSRPSGVQFHRGGQELDFEPVE